ncbi:MAG TPA: aminoglycoside phosphotransferase family protein [Gammaproteobacteria bacterium]|nr:aminoglycoside phosphotransferase family protein [Gammaproteobacteria bacterium]
MKNPNLTLPSVHSFEEYEKLKLNTELFKNGAKEIIHQHQLPDGPLSILEGTNIVFAYGSDRIIKIFPPFHRDQFISDTLVMKNLNGKISANTPMVEFEGEISSWPYVIMNRLDGTLLEGLWEKLDHDNKMIIMRELGALIREVHSLPVNGLEAIDSNWEEFIEKQIHQCTAQHRSTKLPENLLQQIPEYLKSNITTLPKIKYPVILTGEYTPMNFLVRKESGMWHIHGLIDFGDSMLGLPEYDLLGPGVFLIQGDKVLLREFLISYGYLPHELTETLSRQLTILMLLHRYSNLNVQIRIKNWQDKVNTLYDLENLVWGF